MAGSMQTAYTVYPLQSYSFGSKDKKQEKDANIDAKMARLKADWERDGLRRSVEGILLVAEHNHPHVLLLQLAASFYKLPGGRLRAGEDEVDGLRRKLANNLSPTSVELHSHWDVGEVAGVFWRPNFDNQFYPYMPAHLTRPKEVKKIYIVPLPEKTLFAVPRNMRLVAVPLYELYDNMARYGPVLSSLPLLVSRFRLNLVNLPPPMPPAGPPTAAAALPATGPLGPMKRERDSDPGDHKPALAFQQA